MSTVGFNSIYPMTISTTGNSGVSTHISTTGDGLIPMVSSQPTSSGYGAGLGLDSSYYYDMATYNALSEGDSGYETDDYSAADLLSAGNAEYNPVPGLGENPSVGVGANGRLNFGLTDGIMIATVGVGQGVMFNCKNSETRAKINSANRQARIDTAKMLGIDTTEYNNAVTARQDAKDKLTEVKKEWGKSDQKAEAKKTAKTALKTKKTAQANLDKKIDSFKVGTSNAKTNSLTIPANFNITDSLEVDTKKLNVNGTQIELSDADAKYLSREKKPWYLTEEGFKNSKKKIVDKAITKHNASHGCTTVQIAGGSEITLTAKEMSEYNKGSDKTKTSILKKAAKRTAQAANKADIGTVGSRFKSAFKSNVLMAAAGNLINSGITAFSEYEQTGELGKQTVKSLATGTVNTVITSAATAIGTALFPGVGTVAGFLIGSVLGGVSSWASTKLCEAVSNNIPGWSDQEIAEENAAKAAKKAGATTGTGSAQVITSAQLEAQLSQMSEAEQETFIAQVQQAVQAGQIVIQ